MYMKIAGIFSMKALEKDDRDTCHDKRAA